MNNCYNENSILLETLEISNFHIVVRIFNVGKYYSAQHHNTDVIFLKELLMHIIKSALEKIGCLFLSRKKNRQEAIGRNQPCWCGSNKKYKYCHLESDKKNFRNPAPGSKNDLSPTHRRFLGFHDFNGH